MADGVGSMPISLRVPNDLLQKLDEIASATDRPRSSVCGRFGYT
jgi:predicted transcriptional regulator